MRSPKRWLALLATMVTMGSLLAACGSSSSSKTSSNGTTSTSSGSATTAVASSILGKPDKATGTPYVFAMINLVGAPVSFPQASQAAQAAIDYVNDYEGGLQGHPIELKMCANTTLEAPASATCANELVGDHPLLVLGGADTGAAGAFPIWQAHNLAYIGGSPFTPTESNAKNAVIFNGFSGPDNVATMRYAATKLGVKNVAVIEANDTQGIAVGTAAAAAAKADGMSTKLVPLSDTASTSDFAAAAAQAESSNPGMIFLEVPSECPQTMIAIQQTGYKGKLSGTGPCSTPPALKAAGSAANGFIFAQPNVGFDQVHTTAWGHQIALTEAILAKYAPSDINLDSNALAPFGAVMNIRSTLESVKTLNEQTILAAFENGANHANWLAHPYTCNRKQDSTQAAVCNAWQQMFVVENGTVSTLSTEWVSGS